MSTTRIPRTADGDDFRFRAGRASLDLCSTLLWRYAEPVEQLHSGAAVARWFVESGGWPSISGVSDAQVEEVQTLREACYRLFVAHLTGRCLDRSAVAILNRCARQPDPCPQLDARGQVSWLLHDPLAAGMSWVARDAIDLLAGPLSDRLRECAAPDCAFLFVDTSRPGARRWCATNRCGNRERLRAHRRRTAAPTHQTAPTTRPAEPRS